jgi:hypothetical protein
MVGEVSAPRPFQGSIRARVVTLDVFQENHVRRTLSGRTSESTDRWRMANPSGGRQGRMAGRWALADGRSVGTSGWPLADGP